ncbi:MAG: hypothetical protein WD016_08690 [Balneolaceae bacterium]
MQLKLLTTDSLNVSWNDISNFATNYHISLKDQNGYNTYIVDKSVNMISIKNDFILNDKINIKLRGSHDNLYSDFTEATLNIKLDPANISGFQHISDNEVAVIISDLSQVRREINIFRKTENSEYQELGTVDKGNSTFLDNTVDPTKTYTYYASTALAMNSVPLKLHYGKSFKHLSQISELSNFAIQEERIAHREGSSKIVFFSNNDPMEATIYDVATETVLLTFNLVALPKKIAFNNNETKIYTTNYDNSTIHVYDFETGTVVDSVKLQYSGINEFSLLNAANMVATVHTNYTDWELISIDLTSHDFKVIEALGVYNPYLILNKTNDNLLLVYETGSGSNYDFYSISAGEELIFNDRKQHHFFTTNFSGNLDTATVVGPDNISLYDVDTGERLWHFEHSSIRNYCCSNVQLLPEKHVVIQSQTCSYLLNTKVDQKPITDIHCDESSAARQGLLSAAGLAYMDNTDYNFILDFRRSHMSGQPSFIDKLTLKQGWKKIFRE